MNTIPRRAYLASLPVLGIGWATGRLFAAEKEETEKDEEDVTPAEDLMREHGLLKRVLLVYDEVRDRIAEKKAFPAEAVTKAARIIQSFIEQYHEKLEEEHLFPRFRKKNTLVALVDTLEAQHKAGRRVTERILSLSGSMKTDADKQPLAESLRQFNRMYAPHEAREDTVLFPALHAVVSKHEYAALGEDFEKKEHELFGKDGFEGMVDQIATLEKDLGIYELSQFTPALTLDRHRPECLGHRACTRDPRQGGPPC